MWRCEVADPLWRRLHLLFVIYGFLPAGVARNISLSLVDFQLGGNNALRRASALSFAVAQVTSQLLAI